MADKKANTWLAKGKRTLTCLLPVADNRHGKCKGCGECCKLPNKCIFLKYDKQGKSSCSVYSIRPLNCRKYPRTERESVVKKGCGYKFH